MNTEPWISLMDYSNKYQVSLSTLRRRIKTNQIKYQFKAGKYYITDKAMDIQPELESEPTISDTQTTQSIHSAPEETKKVNIYENSQLMHEYLGDLKKAYSQVLHEKEEVIQLLREEIADLKTLVKVLESENSRLNASMMKRF